MPIDEINKAEAEIYVDTAEGAKYMGYAKGTVYNMRSQGRGPDYIKIGRTVKYSLADIKAWMNRHKVFLCDE